MVFIVVTGSLSFLWSSAISATMTLCECLTGTAWTIAGCWHSSVVTTASHHPSCILIAIKCSSSSSLTITRITQDSQQLLSSIQVCSIVS